jgi:hypothetical protein
MTKYQRYREDADFYTSEAIRHYHNPIKRVIFTFLARKYEKLARRQARVEVVR